MTNLEEKARLIFEAALAAADPHRAVESSLQIHAGRLQVQERTYDLSQIRCIFIAGCGKASAAMAQAAENVLGDRITAGLVVVKYGHTVPLQRVELHEAGHPLPDENSLLGTQRMLDLLARAGPDDLVICLISGGGSALLELPAAGLTLADLRAVNDALLRSGATITEMNTIRKHLSQVKGGQLARRAGGAQVIALVLSDVPGSPLDMIASGPTVPDPTTFADAIDIIERRGLGPALPAAALAHLERGQRGELPDTPRPGDPLFEHVQSVIVADNSLACQAALDQACALGFNPLLLTTVLQGEAREAAKFLAAVGREVRRSGRPVPAPACLVAGGETTVTIRGRGLGGRSQELALALAIELDGLSGAAFLAAGTDGSDGPTKADGAWGTGETAARAAALGLDPHRLLDNNDSYHFFEPLGQLIVTGPTGTNVNDLVLVLVI